MEIFLTSSNIMFAIGLVGVIFTVYLYFRNPQIRTEKIMIKEKIETEKSDALMSQKLQWYKDASDVRFKEMQESFQSLLLQSNNHIHTVDTKVEVLTTCITEMGKDIVRLATIIEERIPRK